MDPGTIAAISAITAGISAGGSIVGDAQRNSAVKKSKKSAEIAAAVRTRQLSAQAQVETTKREQEAQRAKAAIRAAAAAAGAGFEGSSFAQLSTQAEIDRATNDNIAQASLGFNFNRIQSDLNATLVELDSQRANMLVSGLTGAAQGASAGLDMYNSLNQLFPPQALVDPDYFPIDSSYMPGSTALGSNRPR